MTEPRAEGWGPSGTTSPAVPGREPGCLPFCAFSQPAPRVGSESCRQSRGGSGYSGTEAGLSGPCPGRKSLPCTRGSEASQQPDVRRGAFCLSWRGDQHLQVLGPGGGMVTLCPGGPSRPLPWAECLWFGLIQSGSVRTVPRCLFPPVRAIGSKPLWLWSAVGRPLSRWGSHSVQNLAGGCRTSFLGDSRVSQGRSAVKEKLDICWRACTREKDSPPGTPGRGRAPTGGLSLPSS